MRPDVTLKKPPIVEMWVEFNFDPNPGGGVPAAFEFLRGYAEQYPELEILHEDSLEFRQVSPKKLPEVVRRQVAIQHIRARDAAGSRWLHLTPTQLVCNFLRLGESYPGFSALSEDAVAKLTRYVEVCKPTRLKYVAIHYVDVIEVPMPESGEIQLKDYFTLGLDLPADPFGHQQSYLLRTVVSPSDGTGPLEIQLQFELFVVGDRVWRFRMDWHKSRPYDTEVDLRQIPTDLRKAHEAVMRCFRAAFTNRAWQLFDPQ
jgi:uncharacterized protein (TIGR04255 family)